MYRIQLAVLSALVWASLVSSIEVHAGIEEFVVEYEVLFPDNSCVSDAAPFSAAVTVPRGSNILAVMELAVNQGKEFRFSTTYFGSTLGYFIDAINKIFSDKQNSCYWFIYTKATNSEPYKPNFGVSNFVIPANGTKVMLQYEKYVPDKSHDNTSTTSGGTEMENDIAVVTEESFQVNYVIRTPDPDCRPAETVPSPVRVSIPRGGSALNVLEGARDANRSYQFSATYFGSSLGYQVDTLAGTGTNPATNYCFWFVYYQPPKNNPYFLNYGVSNFVLPVDGGVLIMQYERYTYNHTNGTEPANEPGEDGSSGLVTTASVLVSVLSLLCVLLAAP